MNSAFFDPEIENQIREALNATLNGERKTAEDEDFVGEVPTNVVSNTSPWFDKVGLWEANPGNDPTWKPKQELKINEEEEETQPEDEVEAEESSENEPVEDEDGDLLSDEELAALFDELAEELGLEEGEEVAGEKMPVTFL